MSSAPASNIAETEEQEHKDVTEEWQDDANDQIEELMLQRGETMPSMKVLLKDTRIIDAAIEGKGKAPAHIRHESDDTDELEREILEMGKSVTYPRKAPVKPHYISYETSADSPQNDPQYQESFASQQEAAELREEMATIVNRLSNMESTLEMVLKERKNLPTHLERITHDINKQFTLMNERLNASIEAGIPSETAQQTAERLQNVTAGATTILDVVKTDLENPPSGVSQITRSKTITGKKKRIQLLD